MEIKESCGATFITVKWDKVNDGDLPVLGYMLEMTTHDSAIYETIYDGKTNSDLLQFTKYGLKTGELYKL